VWRENIDNQEGPLSGLAKKKSESDEKQEE